MIFQKVQETIASHNLIKSDEHIVLGLSGGPDSVCLFHILLRLRQTLGIRLHPVHVNHGLRLGAAERDQNYVEELCREHGISCKVIAADCRELAGAWHMTSEEAGRKLRYDAFYDEARQIAEKDVYKRQLLCRKTLDSHRLRSQGSASNAVAASRNAPARHSILTIPVLFTIRKNWKICTPGSLSLIHISGRRCRRNRRKQLGKTSDLRLHQQNRQH